MKRFENCKRIANPCLDSKLSQESTTKHGIPKYQNYPVLRICIEKENRKCNNPKV